MNDRQKNKRCTSYRPQPFMAEANCLILPCYSPKGFHAATGSFTVCLPISYEPGLPGLVLSPFVVIGLSAFEILADSGEGRAGQGLISHYQHLLSAINTDANLDLLTEVLSITPAIGYPCRKIHKDKQRLRKPKIPKKQPKAHRIQDTSRLCLWSDSHKTGCRLRLSHHGVQ